MRWVVCLAAVALGGCMAGRAATGVVKTTGKVAGTVVETAWDTVTTTPAEAEEDRAKQARKERRRAQREEKQRRERARAD
ncbi:MAG: hypothetical protein SNJ63_03925 [Sphingomonadaceae bacterium]